MLDYLIDYEPNLIILTFFYDEGQYDCISWGFEGNSQIPIIVNDGAFNGANENEGFDKLFYSNNGTAPKHIFIDKDLKLRFKEYGELGTDQKIFWIKEMLDEIEGE